MSGPLPNATRRRRNEPTIPTTNLPASGRKGRAPKPPRVAALGPAGKAWWRWAWATPQAAAWDSGAAHAAANRAALEDKLAALDDFDHLNLAEFLGIDDSDMVRQLSFIIGQLKGMAGGSVTVMREMRELDKRLGLDPKALAELRWTIVAEQGADPVLAVKPLGEERKLRAV